MIHAFRAAAVVVCAWVLVSWSLPVRAESPELEGIEAQTVAVRGDQIGVTVLQPCWTVFMGWIIHQDDTAKILRIGALVRHNNTTCAGLPKRFVGSIHSIRTGNYRKIIPYKTLSSNSTELKLARVSEIRSLRHAGNHEAEAIVALHCGLVIGSVISQQGGVTSLGIVESMPPRRNMKQSCAVTERTARFPFLALADSESIRPLATIGQKDADIRDTFSLRIARTISIARTEGLDVNFIRRCNEAPVGVVLGNPNKKDGSLSVGVLVARYPKLACDARRSEWIQNTWHAKGLRLPTDVALNLMDQTQQQTKLLLKTPIKYGFASTGTSAKGLTFKFLGGCQRPFGAVYAPDQSGALTVAVLEQQQAAECLLPVQEITMNQPTIFAGTAARDLFPMELKGLGAAL